MQLYQVTFNSTFPFSDCVKAHFNADLKKKQKNWINSEAKSVFRKPRVYSINFIFYAFTQHLFVKVQQA